MSIRKRDVHFSDWTKVRHALVCNDVQGITETSSFEDVRAFLINSESGSNPFYYHVCYIKETKEIYTHGQFYDCYGYDDTSINERISEIEESINLKADLSLVNELINEVEENETVSAKALTDLNIKKADRTEIPDVSSFALKSDLDIVRETTESKVSYEELATINGNSLCGNDITIETPDHYSNTPSSEGSGFVSNVEFNNNGHIVKVTKTAITSTDLTDVPASKITGIINIENLPSGALERLFIEVSEDAALGNSNITEGDVVQIGDGGQMYFCVKNSGTFDERFRLFTAGAATSVPWEGITKKPDLAYQDELNIVDAKFSNYLPLSGGNLTGTLSSNSDISTTGMVRGTSYLSTGHTQISSNIDSSIRTSIFGDNGSHWGQIKIFRTGGNTSYGSLYGSYAPGILFAMNDTHSFIQIPSGANHTGEAIIGGGGADEIRWSAKLLHSLNYRDYALPKTGGTLSGALTISTDGGGNQFAINNTSGGESYFFIQSAGVNRGAFTTANASYGTCIYNASCDGYLGITDAGVVHFQGQAILHSGNVGSYALPITGGVVDGYLDVTSTIKGNSVVVATHKMRVNAGDAPINFGYMRAESYSSNRGLIHIGSNYGGSSTVTNDAVDVDAIGIYRGCVGIGRTFTGEELYDNYNNNKKLYVDGSVYSTGTITATTLVGSYAGGLLSGNWIGMTNNGSGGYISLYNNTILSGTGLLLPAYGISFSMTSNTGHGTHGDVSGDWATYFTLDGSNNRGWIFKMYNKNVASISGTGVVSGSDFKVVSDERLKDFTSEVEVDFDNLKSIPKKYYYWKDKYMGEDLQIGTSAQELAKIYPTCVSYNETTDTYTVNYQKLSIIALAAIDKLHDMIIDLKNKIK